MKKNPNIENMTGAGGGPKSVQELLDWIETAEKGRDRISLDTLLDLLGAASFSPVLLLAGLITLAPVVGDIPGMPTIMGLLVLFTGVQMLFGKEHFWLPQWLLKRSIEQNRFRTALKWLRPAAGLFDRISKPRLTWLITGSRTYAVAVVSVGIALVMPALELVPFSANAAGVALTAFGLSLIARDGVIALIAFTFTAITFGVVLLNLL